MENDDDVRVVSELMEDIRDVVADYQVSGNPTVSKATPFEHPV